MRGTREQRMADLMRGYPVWEPQTIWSRFTAAVSCHRNREFLRTDSGRTLTYEQTCERVLRIAAGFSSLGVSAGSFVAVKMSNCLELPLVALALYRLGAVKVAVYAGLGAFETSYVVDTVGAPVLVTNEDLAFFGEEAPASLEHVVTVGDVSVPEGVSSIAFASLEASAQGLIPEDAASSDDVCDIIFTSGTTGDPKGVPLTHDKLLRSSFANIMNRGFEDGRRVFVPLPLLHCYGLVQGMLGVLFVGGCLLLNDCGFDVDASIELMASAAVDDMLCVPIQAEKIIRRLQEVPRDFSSLHAVYCSGAPCPTWVLGAIHEQFGVADIINGYGLTETSGATVQTVPLDSDEVIDTRVGRILPAGCAGLAEYGGNLCECRVVDPVSGAESAPGEVGELWWRGACVADGYFRNPTGSAEAFLDGGWFRSGDLGRIDEAGYVELAGRIKDSYRINGENVSPRFLERIVERCPLIRMAVIQGIPDARLGAVGALFAELFEDTEANRQAVRDFCRANLASHQVPKHYVFLGADEWPRSHTGKIQGFKLQELVTARRT